VFLVIAAAVVVLAVGNVFLLAYFSPARAARPEGPRWRAFRNGLRRRQTASPVDVSLAEMLQLTEPDAPAPFAAFDQMRQRAVDQAARAAGLAAALVAREPSVDEQALASEDPFSDLSFSELEIARAELALAELTLAKMALADPEPTAPERPLLVCDRSTAPPTVPTS